MYTLLFKYKQLQVSLANCGEFTVKHRFTLLHSGDAAHGQ